MKARECVRFQKKSFSSRKEAIVVPTAAPRLVRGKDRAAASTRRSSGFGFVVKMYGLNVAQG